jgi:hypothetical protein
MEKPSKDYADIDISPIPFLIKERGIFGFFKWRISQRHWVLNEDFIFWCETSKLWIKIPKGFVSDAASIPKILHFVINPIDAILFGSLVHDFIYRFDALIVCDDENFGDWTIVENISRVYADKLLREISMQYDKIPWAAEICYWTIIPFGYFAWERARDRNYKLTSVNPDPHDVYLNKGISVRI